MLNQIRNIARSVLNEAYSAWGRVDDVVGEDLFAGVEEKHQKARGDILEVGQDVLEDLGDFRDEIRDARQKVRKEINEVTGDIVEDFQDLSDDVRAALRMEAARVSNMLRDKNRLAFLFLTSPDHLTRATSALRLAFSEYRRQHVLQRFASRYGDEFKHFSDRRGFAVLRNVQSQADHVAGANTLSFLRRLHLVIRSTAKWEEAKEANDFNVVKPHFVAMIRDVRERAKAKAEIMGVPTPYDALMDEFTPGLRCEHIDMIAEGLIPHCQKQRNLRLRDLRNPEVAAEAWHMPVEKQLKLSERILDMMGIPEEKREIKTASHPICVGNTKRVHVALRFDENDFHVFGAGHSARRGAWPVPPKSTGP